MYFYVRVQHGENFFILDIQQSGIKDFVWRIVSWAMIKKNEMNANRFVLKRWDMAIDYTKAERPGKIF